MSRPLAPSTIKVFDPVTGTWIPISEMFGDSLTPTPPKPSKPKPRRRPRKPIVVPPPPANRPTPEEIAQACREIRKGWSRREHAFRAGLIDATDKKSFRPWTVPEVKGGSR